MSASDELAHYMDATTRMRKRAEKVEAERDQLYEDTRAQIANLIGERDQLREDKDALRMRAEHAEADRVELVAERDRYRDQLDRSEREKIEAVAERGQLRELVVLLYRERPVVVARLCDEKVDRSGRLLGEVRKWMRSPPEDSTP